MLTPAAVSAELVERTGVRLRPDPARVIAHLFVAGEELSSGSSRASPVMERVLAMSDEESEAVLAATVARFEDRHLHLAADLLEHFNQISDRLGVGDDISATRRMLLGAYATSEYAIEAVALCNPSIVPHPDQGGLGVGELRFVVSLRAIGEGHLSSIEFRTGTAGSDGQCRLDDPGRLVSRGHHSPSTLDREQFRALLSHAGHRHEVASLILDRLPTDFSNAHLEHSIATLNPQILTRWEARETIEAMRITAQSSYTVVFPEGTEIGQRVLRPHGPKESHGMEDARFVRLVEDDGTATYFATYTAFDGTGITPQLLRTDDFRTFQVSQLAGRAATNKGMALFPRRIRGRYVALSRWDRERNAITTSADASTWDDPIEVQSPEEPWELIQVGNCGSPIETPEGWIVITHGVGPMRTYCLGAMLLDLDQPTTVRGRLRSPLLSPDSTERNGYVPNVVYSCGALRHEQRIILPFAHGDSETEFGRIFVPDLLNRLLGQ